PELLDRVQRNRRLTEGLVLLADRLYPRQVQQRVQEHRGVAGGEDEPVAVRPDRVLRVEAEELLPEAVRDRGEGHRRAGGSGVGRLDRVHRQGADRVDAEGVEVGSRRGGHRSSPSTWSSFRNTVTP